MVVSLWREHGGGQQDGLRRLWGRSSKSHALVLHEFRLQFPCFHLPGGSPGQEFRICSPFHSKRCSDIQTVNFSCTIKKSKVLAIPHSIFPLSTALLWCFLVVFSLQIGLQMPFQSLNSCSISTLVLREAHVSKLPDSPCGGHLGLGALQHDGVVAGARCSAESDS